MHTLHALTITFGIIIIGLILLYAFTQITELITHKKVRLRSLFINFKQKMWMTAGLGIFFAGLYGFLLYYGSIKLDGKAKQALFHNVYQNPVHYIYLGLFIFVSISIIIYILRLIIIYFYNSKKR